MKKKVLLPFGLLAAALVIGPSTAFANLVLDMPPILAKAQPGCTSNATCAAATPSTPYCCNGVCQATVCPTTCTSNATCAAATPSTPYCCNSICQATVCPVPTGGLNDTGITDKVGTGLQDADFGRDKTNNVDTDGHAGFSFAKITSGGKTCVQDTVTGLTWSPDMGSTYMSSGIASLIDANSSLCGKTGWRLPTLDELLSIVSYYKINPAIDNDATRGFFSDTQNVVYWSSTQSATAGKIRWGVNFSSGTPASIDEGLDSQRVRLVQK